MAKPPIRSVSTKRISNARVPISKVADKKTPKWPKGLPVARLLAGTPSKATEKAQTVGIKTFKTGIAKIGLPTYSAVTRSREPTTAAKPPQHKTMVRYIPGSGDRVWVSCSCESFMYTWEYALWKNGASSIVYSNGEPAVMTNPANRPGLCPHLYKVLSRASTVRSLQRLVGE